MWQVHKEGGIFFIHVVFLIQSTNVVIYTLALSKSNVFKLYCMSMCAFVGVCYIECILNINWKLKLIEKMNQINFNGCWSKIYFNCYSHEMYIVWIAYPHFVLLILEGSWKINMPWMKWFGNQNRILYWNFKLFSTKYFLRTKFPWT